ncbi:roadblock/LC7 domain-containing protein [Bounagaea algeriensis]
MFERDDELTYLLDDLVHRVAGTWHAIALSLDGLLAGSSSGLAASYGEHLAALASTLQSVARETGRRFAGGGVRQTLVEMDHGFLFVTSTRSGACLAVLADVDVDPGEIAYEMNLIVSRVADCVHTAPRPVLGAAHA